MLFFFWSETQGKKEGKRSEEKYIMCVRVWRPQIQIKVSKPSRKYRNTSFPSSVNSPWTEKLSERIIGVVRIPSCQNFSVPSFFYLCWTRHNVSLQDWGTAPSVETFNVPISLTPVIPSLLNILGSHLLTHLEVPFHPLLHNISWPHPPHSRGRTRLSTSVVPMEMGCPGEPRSIFVHGGETHRVECQTTLLTTGPWYSWRTEGSDTRYRTHRPE